MRKHIIPFLVVLGLHHNTRAGFWDFFDTLGNTCSRCGKDTNLQLSKLDQFRNELETAKAEVTFYYTKQFIASFSSETSDDSTIKFFWKMQILEGEDERFEKIINMMQPTDPEYKSADFRNLRACDPDLEFQVPLKKFFSCLSDESAEFCVVCPGNDITDFHINLRDFCFTHRDHDQALFLKNLSDFSIDASRELQKDFVCPDPDSPGKDIRGKKRAIEAWLYDLFRETVPSTYISEVMILVD